MNTESIFKIAKWVGAALVLFIIASSLIGFSNDEIELRTQFEQKFDERTAFYDKLYKIISQKGQVAIKNDSSFRANVNIIMQARKDAAGTAMKWIKESNPNANFSEVSALYKDLSRAIEAQREGFFIQEKYLQDVQREHKNLIQKFPGSLYNLIYQREPIIYKPITSDRTDSVIKTGKDNNLQVF